MRTRKAKAIHAEDDQLTMWASASPACEDEDIPAEELVVHEDAVSAREETTNCHDCGGALVFDPHLTGDTVGGLALAGWLMCQSCDKGWMSRRGVPADAWKVTGGGHSVDAGGFRIRAESGAGRPALMRRIARVPALEAALHKIARGEGDPKEIAKEVLEATNE